MSYDHWKTTEPPDSADERIEPTEEDLAGDAEDARQQAEDNYNDAWLALKNTSLRIKAERDRYQAALTKIAGWKGYYDVNPDEPLSDYERGANDMLETLQQMAEEAL